jgi:hypothetical protein
MTLKSCCLIKDITPSYEDFKLAKVCEITYNTETKCCVVTYGNWMFRGLVTEGSWVGRNKVETYVERTEYFYHRNIENILSKGYVKI